VFSGLHASHLELLSRAIIDNGTLAQGVLYILAPWLAAARTAHVQWKLRRPPVPFTWPRASGVMTLNLCTQRLSNGTV